MKFSNIKMYALTLLGAMFLVVSSCNNDDGELPITNDLRVLQVRVANEVILSGVTDLSVIPEIELIFSHGLNESAFENALTFSPSVDFSVTYDETKSKATVSFNTPLDYETDFG